MTSFRSYNADFEAKNAQVLGISCDARPSQTAYSSSLGNIPYPLLSDFYPHGAMTQSYGIFNEERGAPNRAIFIVDTDGVIRFKRVYESARDLNPQDILAEIDKL